MSSHRKMKEAGGNMYILSFTIAMTDLIFYCQAFYSYLKSGSLLKSSYNGKKNRNSIKLNTKNIVTTTP